MQLTTHAVSRRLTRVRAAIEATGLDALLVTHLPNLLYLTGFAGTAGALIVFRDRAVLVVDFRYVTAARTLAGAFGDLIGVETFSHSYDEAIADVLLRAGVRRTGIEAAHLSVSRFNAMVASPLGQTLIPTERIVETVRMVKDGEELAILREGGRRLAAVASVVPTLVVEGKVETAIAAEIDGLLRDYGFARPAFDTIVASGPNSALPHAQPTDRRLQGGEATVLDFGGVYDGYCVDLTRTVQLGAVSPALAQLYAAVREAQAAAISVVKPGVRASAVDRAAREVLERCGLGEAFGHGTGHGLGLEVHEEPRISRAQPRLPDVVLEPGMVFTIEPGAYVPGTGGVRIEDDVVVTTTGCDVLTASRER